MHRWSHCHYTFFYAVVVRKMKLQMNNLTYMRLLLFCSWQHGVLCVIKGEREEVWGYYQKLCYFSCFTFYVYNVQLSPSIRFFSCCEASRNSIELLNAVELSDTAASGNCIEEVCAFYARLRPFRDFSFYAFKHVHMCEGIYSLHEKFIINEKRGFETK